MGELLGLSELERAAPEAQGVLGRGRWRRGLLRGCLKSPAMSVFDRCRAASEGAPIALSPLKSMMPIFTWTPFHATTETFQTASQSLWRLEARFQQLQSGSGEYPHIGFTVRHSGLYSQGALDRTGHGDARMARNVAIAIARGAACARLTKAPGRTHVLTNRACVE